jgi:2-polyprenyl-6-methoxyphenol hydroxylase-like FAD-dependent oxidoreductase
MAEFCSCPDSSTMVVRGDLVVGADGLHSRTRAELESKTGSFRATLHSAPAGRHIRYALLALVNSLHVASAS